jgi:hypothetical protein
VRQECCIETIEGLPVTFQVALIGSDGWVLASDLRATMQGGRRLTFETEKIRYENRIASAPFGDECAQIARDQIIDKLHPDPATLGTEEFKQTLERFSEKVWEKEYRLQNDGRPQSNKIRPGCERGIIFISADSTHKIFILGIGKRSNFVSSVSKYVGGDPMNPASYLIERYYEKGYSVDQLSVLAAHAVVQSSRHNTLISGLQVMSWHAGDTDAKFLDADDYRARSQRLEREMFAVTMAAMGVSA